MESSQHPPELVLLDLVGSKLSFLYVSTIPSCGGGRIGSPGSSGQLGQSVFDYIEKLSGRSPVFHNFLYMGERISDSTVIILCKFVCCDLWDFFV
ncbi:hypothetical protein E2C01_071005 [Portunus trituberculatus]|uniref:Uncharacterized protein n=1 Tax=Portunus trituberculatus TaxID=210409 RepID=A0A5B7I6U7_PORTR|nr:hypothetical protein [Portunus trituberculatus]